ncbi:abortive infection family protein [Pseudoalteromonas sp. ACER1]|uniref:abortive infection family protein n=1 Tax=unclassified Pseudoalteromonas TaxID=194690 RepID=UPI001600E2D4|nr:MULTISPECIES: abortive infection family protein [unclassified Pseudoalteromonas]MBB1301286.1 abortive infection family protein [Pseudoalteromonas sp. SR44-8]MCF2849980.1 abortive infection family protein [Pseudoalteromonas sp. PAST1]MCO7213370.1 abortive infection family protein [Pseudoalteromonas sp. ACER1]|tara:strand:- start:5305 stop:6135 length:831 start_codon:yes stop_codon:yes gene_type:complete
MNKQIPAPLIAVSADALSNLETHASMDSLFMYSNAPGEPPEGSKSVKALEWLRRVNNQSNEPLDILGKLIENYMENPDYQSEYTEIMFQKVENKAYQYVQNIRKCLSRYGLEYHQGGLILDGASAPIKSLSTIIKNRDLPAINAEFDRALENLVRDPREAILAACNILEAVCKTFIEDAGLAMPAKKDLQGVWKVIKDELGFDIRQIQDEDLIRILSGLFSTVSGIGALRTHASAAHAEGRTRYNIKPRHARLAVHAAHTAAVFIIESWDEKKVNS